MNKGIEIKACDDAFVVYKDDENIGYLHLHKGVWKWSELNDSFPELTSPEIRQIADKLDQLNNAK